MKKYLKCLLGVMSIGGLATIVGVPLVACSSQPQTIQTQEEPKNKVEDWYYLYWYDGIYRAEKSLSQIDTTIRMVEWKWPFGLNDPQVVIGDTNVSSMEFFLKEWFDKQDKYELYKQLENNSMKYIVQYKTTYNNVVEWKPLYQLKLPKVGE